MLAYVFQPYNRVVCVCIVLAVELLQSLNEVHSYDVSLQG